VEAVREAKRAHRQQVMHASVLLTDSTSLLCVSWLHLCVPSYGSQSCFKLLLTTPPSPPPTPPPPHTHTHMARKPAQLLFKTPSAGKKPGNPSALNERRRHRKKKKKRTRSRFKMPSAGGKPKSAWPRNGKTKRGQKVQA
jgi:hypothetical protein